MADKQLIGSTLAQTTTNAYASVLKIERPPDVTKMLFQLYEDGTNATLYQVLASNVDTAALYATLVTDVSLSDDTLYETMCDAWLFIDIQIKAASGGSQGVVTAYASGEQ